jgi:hypothetical protein
MHICESLETDYLLECMKFYFIILKMCVLTFFIFQIYASDEKLSRNHTTWHCQVEESSLMIAHGLYAMYKWLVYYVTVMYNKFGNVCIAQHFWHVCSICLIVSKTLRLKGKGYCK